MADRRAIVRRGEKALSELELSVSTKADRQRIFRIRAAMRVLDEEQARAKEDLDSVLGLEDPNA